MSWEEVSPGVWRKVEKQEIVVDVNELQRRLAEIQAEKQEILSQFLTYPEDASDEIKQAIDLYNQSEFGPRLADLESEELRIKKILEEIGVGS